MTTEKMITMMTSAMTAEIIGVMIDTVRTTTTTKTATAMRDLHHHHLKGATLMVRFNQPTERSTLSSMAAK
jgi:NifU-like protein involved in Fe-S cluster formation